MFYTDQGSALLSTALLRLISHACFGYALYGYATIVGNEAH